MTGTLIHFAGNEGQVAMGCTQSCSSGQLAQPISQSGNASVDVTQRGISLDFILEFSQGVYTELGERATVKDAVEKVSVTKSPL